MRKEFIICVVLIIIIILGNNITQKYTENTMEKLIKGLEEIEVKIEDKKEIEKDIKKVIEEWDNKSHKLAYFIEHNELEKIEKNLLNIENCIKNKGKLDVNNKIEKTKFLLENVKNKYKICLENIF